MQKYPAQNPDAWKDLLNADQAGAVEGHLDAVCDDGEGEWMKVFADEFRAAASAIVEFAWGGIKWQRQEAATKQWLADVRAAEDTGLNILQATEQHPRPRVENSGWDLRGFWGAVHTAQEFLFRDELLEQTGLSDETVRSLLAQLKSRVMAVHKWIHECVFEGLLGDAEFETAVLQLRERNFASVADAADHFDMSRSRFALRSALEYGPGYKLPEAA